MRFRSSAALSVAFIGLLFPPLPPAELTQSNVVLVREGDVVTEDLYAAGNIIEVRGLIEGDLVAAAFSEIRVLGEVTGSVTALAGAVTVTGEVGGSVRAIAGSVDVLGEVGEDVLVAAWSTEAGRDAQIGRDLAVWGRSLSGAARVGRDVLGWQRSTLISGLIANNVDISTGKLTVEPSARVGGDVAFTSSRDAAIAGDAEVAGSVIKREPLPPNIRIRAMRLMATVLALIGSTAIGALLIWAFGERAESAVKALRERPLGVLAWGAGITAAVPALIAVTGLAIGLSPPAAGIPLLAVFAPLVVASTSLLMVGLLAAPVPVATVLGGALFPRSSIYARFAAGMLVIAFLAFIPWLNLLAVVGLAVLGLGSWLLSS